MHNSLNGDPNKVGWTGDLGRRVGLYVGRVFGRFSSNHVIVIFRYFMNLPPLFLCLSVWGFSIATAPPLPFRAHLLLS